MQSGAKSVAAYLASLPADRRAAISALRDVIRANLDADYEEGIQYGMIGYMGKSCVRFTKLENVALEVVGEAIRRIPAKVYVERYLEVMAGAKTAAKKSAKVATKRVKKVVKKTAKKR